MKILVTGAAGFVGFHVCKRLLDNGYEVLGVDNCNNYYDPNVKFQRLELLSRYSEFKYSSEDINLIVDLKFEPTHVIHLAAYAGVRFSIYNPGFYIRNNIEGFKKILDLCNSFKHVENLIYASSSSVYGGIVPGQRLHEKLSLPVPRNMYALSKISNEMMAERSNIPTTGMRFFTVYGPWGRPDMAMWIFAEKMMNNKPIQLFNSGNMFRDFTYIDDIVDGIMAILHREPTRNCIYNLGTGYRIDLKYVVESIAFHLGVKNLKIDYLCMQEGDIETTQADISKAHARLGYEPKFNIDQGIEKFCNWFRGYVQ